MAEPQKTWEHRLAKATDSLAVDFVESLSFDTRLYKYDIVGSIAHAEMLCEQKLLTRDELKQIKDALVEISKEIEEGKFKFDKTLEDIHMAIEAALTAKIGEAGKKLHTGRSRNDQVATDIRLWMRDEIEIIQTKIALLQKALVKLAEKYTDNVMPAYTHFQRAQPISIAAYILSFVEQLHRDYLRLKNCRTILNVSPLGSGAIAGSSLPLDRKKTASLLGFADITYNTIDAVSDRDFCAEFIFCCSMIATHLSKFAEDWIVFSTTEFDFIRIDDAFCTSSSMMPQKRNPDMLELIRGKTGSIYGSLMAILTILKAQPSGYNRDLQDDKRHVFSTSDTIEAYVDMAAAIAANTSFKTEKIAAGIDKGFLDATALAEYLVKKGIPFRTAHGIVGTLVAKCEKENKSLAEVSIDEFKKHSEKIGDDVYGCLGGKNVANSYVTASAASPAQMAEQIKYWKKQLEK
ncbi:MAG: Argininosuccinate lyase 1 [Planctomycetes bacterium ADurb.Bin401]|nr:MAG: Argininosuccinate lyase 1 [Planctomycetes bacterium ADurb.Bin401]